VVKNPIQRLSLENLIWENDIEIDVREIVVSIVTGHFLNSCIYVTRLGNIVLIWISQLVICLVSQKGVG